MCSSDLNPAMDRTFGKRCNSCRGDGTNVARENAKIIAKKMSKPIQPSKRARDAVAAYGGSGLCRSRIGVALVDGAASPVLMGFALSRAR